MKTKQLTLSALLIAIGSLSAHVIYIPVGVSKCFPVQHFINVLSAVLLGPVGALINAFIISLLRNIIGTGSLLAFPGSMIGALLSGILYSKRKNINFAIAGEIIGTGLIGSLVSIPIANILMGKNIGATFFILPFSLSTISGSVIAYFILKVPVFQKIINTISTGDV
ncbi:energy coupling factor transporter S component ThiW [Clostridium sp. ZS2-4]|uniref:energy coupling factor transporter S component ThiW n=1 Tax=Clostridium sp. ZS2-4 TaxID=2987703 RepID=UPI00227A033F|nr:energy coupling factor transporter S component ThiW [Clostridium sp. ZS2-4]MCY6355676.1 energy coupling factor transporter S component ThiW [Clostridium sp. ZS2-4]